MPQVFIITPEHVIQQVDVERKPQVELKPVLEAPLRQSKFGFWSCCRRSNPSSSSVSLNLEVKGQTTEEKLADQKSSSERGSSLVKRFVAPVAQAAAQEGGPHSILKFLPGCCSCQS